jgi:predicted nucleotidyltransferase
MVAMRQIHHAAKQIAQRFNPRSIILFGSYAYGEPNADSDVDFLVLLPGARVHDRAIAIRNAIDFDFPVDLLVRSPEEFDRRINLGDGFLKEIRDKGKILYEAADTGVDQKGRGRFSNRAARSPRSKIAKLR